MGFSYKWFLSSRPNIINMSHKGYRIRQKAKRWLRGFREKRQSLITFNMARKITQEKNLHNTKEFYKLYEDELESDVTLWVGPEGWQERVPAHSWVLSNNSEYFEAYFRSPLARSKHSFPDDPKGFNNLIRWLYQNKCDLQSLQGSLDTLNVAIKYLCPELAERCIIHIRSQLNPNNVIRVLRWIYLYCYCPSRDPPSSKPSAPSLEELEDTNGSNCTSTVDPTENCHLLLNECLEMIDQHSDAVLSSESLLLAELPVLQMVLKRDTLTLSSELKVLKALYKWSTSICKRQHLPLTFDNRRKILGPLLYQARLLTLSPSEVEILSSKQTDTSCLLTKQEIFFIEFFVKKQPLPQVPETMSNRISSMSNPRGQRESSTSSKAMVLQPKEKPHKKKFRFKKNEIILDLVSLLGLIFD